MCLMPRSSSHSARSPAMYEEPLSLSRRGRWATWALSQPDAVSATSSVPVTSSAFIVVHSFQAMM